MLLPTLIARFREREENVKMDIFATFNDLLTQVSVTTISVTTISVTTISATTIIRNHLTCNHRVTQVAAARDGEDAADSDAMATDSTALSPTALLSAEVPRIVKAASRQLREKSVKTRIAAFHCLRQLAVTLPGCLGSHAALLAPGLDRALRDNASNPLRIEALLFLQQALPSHPPATFHPHVATLVVRHTALS